VPRWLAKLLVNWHRSKAAKLLTSAEEQRKAADRVIERATEIRVHPTGSVIARLGTISQGQGHATTFAQILASELGIPAEKITVEEGDTDTAPYGLGTYGSRSTPVAGAATAMAGRKIRAKAQMIAAHLLEVHDDDLEWDVDRFRVKGVPEMSKTMTELAFAAYNNVPPGMEPGLEAVSYYDPPNMTYPFGAYVCVIDIDVDTGVNQGSNPQFGNPYLDPPAQPLEGQLKANTNVKHFLAGGR
jgi:CO/xanthine dehydrogenase Mo-binding subunit